jgi:2-polyprenyl-6-methoxyphenol hydroxylase-like FAD-dependent oxidoreductase
MKAIIIGAGIAGLATAHALRRAGWDVALHERARGPRTGGYMIDFFGPGYEAAQTLGILPALQQRGHRIDAAHFLDGRGRERAALSYELAARAAGGGKLVSLLRSDIEAVLLEKLPAGVALTYGSTITGIENGDDGVTAHLSGGDSQRADLLVGADGIHSTVRRLVFGPEADFVRFLGYHTAAYAFRDEAASRAVGEGMRMLTVPNRFVGLYALGDGRLASFFVHRAASAELPADPRAALRTVYGDLGWLVPAALAAAPEAHDIYYDVVAQTILPHWHKGRTVVLGDAAYAVSLLAGFGASLAVAGGNALGEVLADGDVALGLQRYEEQLRPLVLQKQLTGRRTAKWFVPPSRAHILFRDLFLNAVNNPLLVGLLGRFVGVSSKGFSLAR